MNRYLGLLRDDGFPQVADALAREGREAIRIRTTPRDDGTFRPGQSKFGGAAHVPAGFAWPEFKGTPLFFIAQINLADLPPSPAASLFPEKGLLSFFFEGGMEAWGYEPGDKGAARVYWFDGAPERLVPVARPDRPDEDMSSASPCALDFATETDISLNSEQVELRPLLELAPDGESERLATLLDGMADSLYDERNGVIVNKMLGWPDLVQGDIFTEAELVTNGLNCGDSSGWNDPRAAGLKKHRHDWLLLFQVDSDANADMMWGDGGRVYFLLKKDDLAARRFDRAWFSFQCG